MSDENTYKSRAKHIMRGASEETLLSDSMTSANCSCTAGAWTKDLSLGRTEIWDGD